MTPERQITDNCQLMGMFHMGGVFFRSAGHRVYECK